MSSDQPPLSGDAAANQWYAARGAKADSDLAIYRCIRRPGPDIYEVLELGACGNGSDALIAMCTTFEAAEQEVLRRHPTAERVYDDNAQCFYALPERRDRRAKLRGIPIGGHPPKPGTWGALKALMEEKGVQDDDRILARDGLVPSGEIIDLDQVDRGEWLLIVN